MNKKIFFFIFIAIFVLPISAYSDQIDDSEDIFTVTDIKTFDDAGDLNDSMEIANNKAIIEGFKHLAFKIIPINFRNKIYNIQEKEILKTVNKIVPTKERMTNHSYMATVNIEYDPAKIKEIFNRYGIRYKTSYSEDFLFIPMFFEDTLAARQNWRWKWLNLNGYFRLLKFKIFKNNVSISLDNKYAALFEPYHTFDEILTEYNVKNLVIVFAEMNKDQLEITIRILKPGEDTLKYLIIKKDFDEDYRSLFNRAIDQLLENFDSELKGVKAFDQKIIFSSKVKINAQTPQIWSAVKNKLSTIPEIKDCRIISSNIDQIEIELNYTIPVQFLKELLQKHGIFLNKQGADWFLTLYKPSDQ